jgi:hypothetical protein
VIDIPQEVGSEDSIKLLNCQNTTEISKENLVSKTVQEDKSTISNSEEEQDPDLEIPNILRKQSGLYRTQPKNAKKLKK